MTVSNTHLLVGSLQDNFVGGNTLKYQRIADIQDVVDDKYSHANGGETTPETENVEETKSAENTEQKVSADDQAKNVAAKEHAPKSEPVRIMGVKLSHILIGAVVIGGAAYGIHVYMKQSKN